MSEPGEIDHLNRKRVIKHPRTPHTQTPRIGTLHHRRRRRTFVRPATFLLKLKIKSSAGMPSRRSLVELPALPPPGRPPPPPRLRDAIEPTAKARGAPACDLLGTVQKQSAVSWDDDDDDDDWEREDSQVS